MIQLKDLTHDYIQSQLKENYEEFANIEFDEAFDTSIRRDPYKRQLFVRDYRIYGIKIKS